MSPCNHHITEFILYLQPKQLKDAEGAGEIKISIGFASGHKGHAWLDTVSYDVKFDHLKMVIVANGCQVYIEGD